jgi:hypothetical protein
LLATEAAGELRGIALGTTRTITLRGKSYTTPSADFEYTLRATGEFMSQPIYRAVGTVHISPAQNVFTDSLNVSFGIPNQDPDDIEFRYTLDGSDPTLLSPIYTEPLAITQDTYVKVRPFRKGLRHTPFNLPSEEAGQTVGAVFRREEPRPALLPESAPEQGLAYEYFEGPWAQLFTQISEPGVLASKGRGKVSQILLPAEVETIRATDKAYALRYDGYMDVPKTGVYSFYAPEHLYTPTIDAGYDLRVWIDGEEWFPSPTLHSENVWHIALEKGLHHLRTTWVDYRWKQFKDEYWMSWFERQMWKGIPVLEISGPHLKKQPLPAGWLFRDPQAVVSK